MTSASPARRKRTREHQFKRLASGASPSEKAKLFSGTAQRVYRLA
jgi:hypothetical protein